MPIMTDPQREEVWGDFMRAPVPAQATDFSKPELRAALNAVDDWVVANQASYNSALPVPFRTNATAEQKAYLLLHVVQKRYLTGA